MLARVNGIRICKQLISLLLFLVFFGWSASGAHAITLVFVHGKNGGKTSVADITSNYWTTDMINASTRNGQARSLVIAYDGTQYYWDLAADVASQINTYLNSFPSERLVFVTHSYGGVVMRWIMCNSSTTSPYYNYHGANYARIANATNYVITLAAPQLGSSVANLGYTLSNSIFTSWIVSLVDNNSNSGKILTTANMTYASQNWLRDSLRTKAFYTVAGTQALNHIYHAECLGLGAIKAIVPSASDGLVGVSSAHGTGAPGGSWFDTTANHHHNRRNDDPGYIGNIIAQYGY